MLRSVARYPRTSPSSDLRGFPEQDGVRRPVGDVVEPDVAVEKEDAVIVERDRRLDVVVAAGVAHRACRRKGKETFGSGLPTPSMLPRRRSAEVNGDRRFPCSINGRICTAQPNDIHGARS